MQAIETEWRGFNFRSRLEARYAVMFEKMGMDWRYEIQGFYLGDDRPYLPDFWLPELELYVEIKGTSIGDETRALLRDFRHPLILFVGLPDPEEERPFKRPGVDGELYTFSISEDNEIGGMPFIAEAHLLRCRECEKWVVDVRPKSNKLTTGECRLIDRGNDRQQWGPHCEHGYRARMSRSNSKVKEAVETAKSARFGHGEDPL